MYSICDLFYVLVYYYLREGATVSKIREMAKDWKAVKVCLYVLLTATLLYILYLILGNLPTIFIVGGDILGGFFSAISPLIIGLILAYLLGPLVETIDNRIMSKMFFKLPSDPVKLERRLNIRRTVSILITFLIIIAAICAIVYSFAVLIVGDLVFTSLGGMVTSVVEYFLKYEETIINWVKTLPLDGLDGRLQGILDSVLLWFSNNFNTSAIISFISGIGGMALNVVLGAVVSIYLIKDKEYFLRLWRKTLHVIFPQKANAVITETLSDINGVLSLFVRGQLLDALIIAIVSSVALTVIGLEFSVFIGIFAGAANVIPYFGPIIGMIPAAIIALFTGGPLQALLAIIILLVIQQIDGNIIYPKIVGSSVGLHPVFVLVAVTLGGYYGGIIGMLIGVPIAAILRVFIIKKLDTIDN